MAACVLLAPSAVQSHGLKVRSQHFTPTASGYSLHPVVELDRFAGFRGGHGLGRMQVFLLLSN